MILETCLTRDVHEAAGFIRAGELVAFPTETVYGLGADATDAAAVHKIFKAKGRPEGNPLIVHLGSSEDVEKVAINLSPSAKLLLKSFFPGPLTIILEKHPSIPSVVTAGLSTVGVRMPDNGAALELINLSRRLIAAPSANISGSPSPTTWQAVAEDLDGRIACILQGAMASLGLESTVVDCTGSTPQILRPGFISLAELQRVVPGSVLSPTLTQIQTVRHHESGRKPSGPKSPGTAFRHYTPRAAVFVVDNPLSIQPEMNIAYIGLEKPEDDLTLKLTHVAPDKEDYARMLFDFFRSCDSEGVRSIYCQSVSEQGVGLAIMDRIRRASSR